MKSLDQKRDEKAKLVQEHFDKIGAATFDVFKYGWNACAKEYEKENAELKRQLEIAKEALNYYVKECSHAPCDCLVARTALKDLESAGK